MKKVNIPEGSNGNWKIEKVKVNKTDFHAMLHNRKVPLGLSITTLKRNNTLVMSDTPAEMSDHLYALSVATGSCLINGLGLGLFLKNILLKDCVTEVTVIEISQDLIDLVSPHYQDKRVKFICCSAFNYKPPKGKIYNMVWHDIWDNICGDNLPEMTRLHRKYGKRTKWQESWCKHECKNNRY
jgi:hypothetical protein